MTDHPDVTATIDNWGKYTDPHGRDFVVGAIFGDKHHRFLDGEIVATGTIQSIEGDIMVTKRSTYRLGTFVPDRPLESIFAHRMKNRYS